MTIVTSGEPRVAVGRPHRPGALGAGAVVLGLVLAGAFGALLAPRPAEVPPEAASAPISASVPAADLSPRADDYLALAGAAGTRAASPVPPLDIAPRTHDDWSLAPSAARPGVAPGVAEPPDRRSDNRLAPTGGR